MAAQETSTFLSFLGNLDFEGLVLLNSHDIFPPHNHPRTLEPCTVKKDFIINIAHLSLIPLPQPCSLSPHTSHSHQYRDNIRNTIKMHSPNQTMNGNKRIHTNLLGQ
jgi:hypothetical protein